MKLQEIEIAALIETDRARQDYGDLEELTESIKDKGLIQPITVMKAGKQYIILAGGRRYRACKEAGFKTMPCIVRTTDKVDSLEIELIENVQRQDFSWVERCKLEEKIYKLKTKDDPSWTHIKTAKLLGRTRSSLSQDLELADAMRIVPELAEADSLNEAWKKWHRIKEDLAVKEIVRQQTVKTEKLPAKTKVSATDRGKFTSFQTYIETKYIISDCFKGMEKLSSAIVDFVEVDPPYAVDLVAHRQKAKDQHIVSTYNEIDEEAYPPFIGELFKELYRVMKPSSWGILWYGSKWYPQVFAGLKGVGFKVTATPAVWVKNGGGYSPNPKMQLANLYENFLVFRKGTPVMAKEGRANVFHFAQPSPKARIHPTERPVDMMEELLKIFTYESSIIMVPFLGSGVTLRAAYNLNRVAFGYDKDGIYKDRLLAKEIEDV